VTRYQESRQPPAPAPASGGAEEGDFAVLAIVLFVMVAAMFVGLVRIGDRRDARDR
jgi:hypothetical protein